MHFLSLPLKNLRRRPLRSVLTMFGIACAVGGYLCLNGLTTGLQDAWTASLVEQGTDALAMRRGTIDLLAGSLDENLAGDLAAEAGVDTVAGELIDFATLDSGETVLLRGWQTGSYLWRNLELASGNIPVPPGNDSAVIGFSLAEALGKAPGDALEFIGGALTISGVAVPAGLLNDSSIILPLGVLQDLLGRREQVTVFNLVLDGSVAGDEVAGVLERLGTRYPDLAFSASATIAAENRFLKLWRAMALGTSIVAVVMGLVVIVNTLLMAVFERRREIGILGAVGWPVPRILALVMLEGLLLSVAGGFFGVVLGIAGLQALSRVPLLHGFFSWELAPALVAQVFAIVVFLGIAGSALPAWRAATARPIESLRYE